MEVDFHKSFKKQYKKRSKKEQLKFNERISVFTTDSFNPLLNNHALRGDRKGEWSIDVTGDLRAIYYFVSEDSVIFVDIDTHSNLYKQ